MPIVPRYEQQVRAAALPAPQFSSGASADAFGAAEARALGSVAEVLNQEHEKANAVQVMNAQRQLSDWRLANIDDPQNGALAKRGKDAFGLPDSITADYDKTVGKIAEGLGNERQKLAFQKMANADRESVLRQVNRHVFGEMRSYAEMENKANVESALSAASLSYQDPERIDAELLRGRTAIMAHAKISGEPSEATRARLDSFNSSVRTATIQRALQERDLPRAESYLKDYSSQMNPDDLVKVSKLVDTAKKSQLSIAVAAEVMKTALPKMQPTEMDRLLQITAGTESNNRDYADNGQPVTSPKGAKYAMQVMPATAKNPGYGIKPAADDSSAEYNRVGREYFGAMLKEYGGDLAKTWAAYNAGPGAVESAIKKADKLAKLAEGDPAVQPRQWLDYLPAETRDYVAKNLKKYDGNVTVAAPTLLDLKAQVSDRLKGEPPEVVEAAKAKVEANYNDYLQDRRQREDQLLTQIQDQTDRGQIKSLADLDAQTLTALGDKRGAARAYIESAGKRSDKVLEMSPVATTFYYELYTDPVKLKETPISRLMELAPDIGQQRVNHLLQKRADYINRPEKEQAAAVDSDQFKALSAKFGFDPKKKEHAAELIQIKDRAEQAIATIQSEQKKTLTREEKGRLIANLMTEFPSVKATASFGPFEWGSTMAKRGYAVESAGNINIPDQAKGVIEKAAAARGVTLSTPAQWRDAYAAYLQAEKGL